MFEKLIQAADDITTSEDQLREMILALRDKPIYVMLDEEEICGMSLDKDDFADAWYSPVEYYPTDCKMVGNTWQVEYNGEELKIIPTDSKYPSELRIDLSGGYVMAVTEDQARQLAIKLISRQLDRWAAGLQ